MAGAQGSEDDGHVCGSAEGMGRLGTGGQHARRGGGGGRGHSLAKSLLITAHADEIRLFESASQALAQEMPQGVAAGRRRHCGNNNPKHNLSQPSHRPRNSQNMIALIPVSLQ